MFEAFLAPPVLLNLESSYGSHHDRRLTLHRSRPSRIVECALPGNSYASLHHFPLDDRQSRHLLSEIETFGPASFIYHEVDVRQERRLRFCQQALVVLSELVARHKQDFTDLDLKHIRKMMDYAEVPRLFDSIQNAPRHNLEMPSSASTAQKAAIGNKPKEAGLRRKPVHWTPSRHS